MKIAKIIVFSLFLCAYQVSAAPTMPPVPVNVASAKVIQWQPELSETGTLVAKYGITVKSEVDGRVVQVFFESGEMVKKDAPLIQLNSDIQKAQLKQYQSDLTLSELQYQRVKKLFDKKIISKAEYDQTLANYRSAQAKVEQAQAQLDQLFIKAPFSGKLGLRQISPGDYVSTGNNLVNLQSMDPIYVDFSVPAVYFNAIKTGESISVQLPAFSKQTFQGKVLAVESLIDPQTRTLKVRAVLPNPEAQLVPGSFVQVHLLLGDKQSVIVVPQTALLVIKGQDMVYVVKDKQAVLMPVKLLKRRDRDALIASGLKAGDQVVTAGQMKLHDHAPVSIVKP